MSKHYAFDGHKLLHHLERVREWEETGFCMPLHLDISATGACNVDCIYCLFNHLHAQGIHQKQIPTDILLQLMRDAKDCGIKSVAFVGDGEIMAHPAAADAVCLAKENGIDVAIATNGLLIKDQDLERMLRALTWKRFSFCASNPESYAKIYRTKPEEFGKLMQVMHRAVAIKREHRLDVTIGSVCCVLPENQWEIINIAATAAAIGLDYLYFKQIVDIPQNVYHIKREFYSDPVLLQNLAYCEALSTGSIAIKARWSNIESDRKPYDRCLSVPFLCHVGSDAKLYLCAPRIGEPAACYGDLRENSLVDILNGSEYKVFLDEHAKNYDVHKHCPASCREDMINRFLWQLKNPPEHVNFI